ncbi:conserved stress protein (fragment) [Bacillus vallismortis]
MILVVIIALCGYLLFSFSKDNRRKPQKTSPQPAAAPHQNNLIDLDAIRQKRRMHLS